jgi:hypothetical protein
MPFFVFHGSKFSNFEESNQFFFFSFSFWESVSLRHPGWPQTHNPPASVSECGITGMHQDAQLEPVILL